MITRTAVLTRIQAALGRLLPDGTTQHRPDLLIISLDIDSYVYVLYLLTEIGLAVLDARDLADVQRDATLEEYLSHSK